MTSRVGLTPGCSPRGAGCADPRAVPRASSAEPAGKQLLPPVPEPEQGHAVLVQPVHSSDHIAGGCKHSEAGETSMHQHFLRHCVCSGFGRGNCSRRKQQGQQQVCKCWHSLWCMASWCHHLPSSSIGESGAPTCPGYLWSDRGSYTWLQLGRITRSWHPVCSGAHESSWVVPL